MITHRMAPPRGTEQYSTLSDPSIEAPSWVPRMGSSSTGDALSPYGELHSYYIKDCLHIYYIGKAILKMLVDRNMQYDEIHSTTARS